MSAISRIITENKQQLLLLSSSLLNLRRAFDMLSMFPSILLSKVYLNTLLPQGVVNAHSVHRWWRVVLLSTLWHFESVRQEFPTDLHLACLWLYAVRRWKDFLYRIFDQTKYLLFYSVFSVGFGSNYFSIVSLLLEQSIVIPFESIFFVEQLLIYFVSFVCLWNCEVVILEIVSEIVDHHLKVAESLILHKVKLTMLLNCPLISASRV